MSYKDRWSKALINWVSVGAVCFNVAITLCLILYAVRLRKIFKGGSIGRSTPYLIGSAAFFFLSAIARSTTVFEILSPSFDPVSIMLRSVAFLLLFAFLIQFVKDWKSLGNR
jgi:hypothetical protein